MYSASVVDKATTFCNVAFQLTTFPCFPMSSSWIRHKTTDNAHGISQLWLTGYHCIHQASNEVSIRSFEIRVGKVSLSTSRQVLCSGECFVGSALVDMYGKCGSIDKAELHEARSGALRLLGRAGMVECAYDLGKMAAQKLFELDPNNSGNHVMLSTMFAATGSVEIMSQEQLHREEQRQPRRNDDDEGQGAIKYGDVFNVSGDLAENPIAPQDARIMGSAETRVLGEVPQAGPADVMHAAAVHNVRVGFLSNHDVSGAAKNQGINISETDIPGARVVTESIAGQVVGQYLDTTTASGTATTEQNVITMGEALEAVGESAGNKPVEQSDVAAIQAAEVRATGSIAITPRGLAATAQSAANFNAGFDKDEDKIKLNYVLTGATAKLTAHKPVNRQDAEGVVSAELRNDPNLTTQPGGVAASIAAAARLNEGGANI